MCVIDIFMFNIICRVDLFELFPINRYLYNINEKLRFGYDQQKIMIRVNKKKCKSLT